MSLQIMEVRVSIYCLAVPIGWFLLLVFLNVLPVESWLHDLLLDSGELILWVSMLSCMVAALLAVYKVCFSNEITKTVKMLGLIVTLTNVAAAWYSYDELSGLCALKFGRNENLMDKLCAPL